MKLTGLLASGSAVAFSSTYERAASLVGVLILSRLLKPAEIGTFALAVSIVIIVGQLLDVGSQWALVSRGTLTPAITWAHAEVQIGTASLILALSIAAQPMAARVFGDQAASLLPIVALARLILAVGITSRLLLEKELRFTGVSAVNVVAATSNLGLGIFLAAHGFGVWALAVGAGPPSLAGAAVQTIGFVALRPLDPRQFTIDWGQIRWYVNYGRPLWVGAQAFAVGTQLDNLVVGLLLGPVALGVYDRSFRLVQTPVALVNQTFGRVMFPTYARIHRDDPSKARAVLERSSDLLVRLSLPTAAFLALSARNLVSLLLGPGWEGAGILLVLFAPYFVLRVLDENFLAFYMGTGRTWERVFGWLIVAGLSIVALPILVRVAGSIGAPIGDGIAMAAGIWWQQKCVSAGSLMRLGKGSVRPVFATVVAGASTLLLTQVAQPAEAGLALALQALSLFTVYAIVLVLLEGAGLRKLMELVASQTSTTTNTHDARSVINDEV